jgi:hypothetical protein
VGSSSQCSSFETSTITLASSEDGGAVHISPRQSLTLLFNQLSSPPSQDLLVEDLVALNIPQIHDSPVDIYIFIYAYPSLSLATVISRIVALALPYDNYTMYAFTYASANTPSLSEARYHSHVVLYVRVQFYRQITYGVAALM